MKSLLIIDDGTRDNHVGEEYDDFLIVDKVLSADDIDSWTDRIRQHIRKLWNEGGKEDGVNVLLDSSPHYDVILLSLQGVMNKDEKVTFVLTNVNN